MAIEFSFPLYFEGLSVPKGKNRPIEGVFVENVVISIPHCDPEDAFLAVEWREQKDHRAISGRSLWFSGSHHLPYGAPLLRSEEAAATCVKEILAYSQTKPSERLRQKGCLKFSDLNPSEIETYDRDRHLLVDDRGRNAAMHRLMSMAERLSVVGDKLYRAVGDPSYSVNRHHKNRPNGRYSYWITDLPANNRYSNNMYFSLNDFERVREFSPGARALSGRYEVDVYMPETLTMDYDAFALIDAALYMKGTVEDLLGDTRSRVRSPEVLDVYIRLGALLPPGIRGGEIAKFPADLDFDAISVEIENLYPYVFADCISYPMVRGNLKHVERVVDTWRGRPVDIALESIAM